MKFLFRIIGVVLLVYSLLASRYTPLNFGLFSCYGASGAFFIYGIFYKFFRTLKWLSFILRLGFTLFTAFVLFLAFFGMNDTVEYNEKALIVLGAGLNGEVPTYALAKRLDKAVEYYAKNPSVLIVVSGAQGPDENIPEAEAMFRYLAAHGIPANQIIKEENSTSTYENMVFSKELFDERLDNYTVLVITNDFHIYRAVRFAKSAGFDPVHTLHAGLPWYEYPINYIREVAALFKMWFVYRVW